MTLAEKIKASKDFTFLTDEELSLAGLTIKSVDYGLWRLRQDGEFIEEGERFECNAIACKLIAKAI